MHSVPEWSQTVQQLQQTLGEAWHQALQAAATPTSTAKPLAFASDKLRALQDNYVVEATALWNNEVEQRMGSPASLDRRFSALAWQGSPWAAFSAAAYLLNSRTLLGLADALEADAKTRARVRFAIEQWAAANAPSNFLALNPDAQRQAIETQGESIAKGIHNLVHDLRQGHVSMTDESRFEVGKNVASTEGAVVFENDFFQLIEYKALTAQVYELPLLLVPPCINKFYILDLQPDNSLIRYAAAQGQRTFVISWRNPDQSMADKTWDDYVEQAVIKAIQVTRAISRAPRINTLGFCVGGTLLASALAVLAARGEQPAASATLLTTFLDFSDTGVLDLFIDEDFVQYREKQMGQGGLLKGQELASTFSFLRPNDLVWNYVVGNYLKGETPPAFDLLYWNCDATNLPGPFYAWYLRQTYLENNLVQPGKVEVCGQKIDFGLLDIPVYIYGSRDDHIVPIGVHGGGCYASSQCWPGPKRFVMGASGHIAGVINPPSKNKRSHWIRADGELPATQAEWLVGAQEHPGSWWGDWAAWLKPLAGRQVAAPKTYGRGSYKAIEPAPGRYVLQKA